MVEILQGMYSAEEPHFPDNKTVAGAVKAIEGLNKKLMKFAMGFVKKLQDAAIVRPMCVCVCVCVVCYALAIVGTWGGMLMRQSRGGWSPLLANLNHELTTPTPLAFFFRCRRMVRRR